MMHITIRKDTLLVSLNPIEIADVGARNAMIYRVYSQIVADEHEGALLGKPSFLSRRVPICYYSHCSAQVHILRIVLGFWQYFRDIQTNSPWEQQIREEVVALGLSGKADELTAHYCG